MHLTDLPPVTLHLGAHRTATSSLQRQLARRIDLSRQNSVAVWTPNITRGGLLAGLMGDPGRQDARRDAMANRAAGGVSMRRQGLSDAGVTRLVISDENMLGGLRENVLLGRLYPTAGARLRRLASAVPGIDHIALALRSPDTWWASTFAFLMTRGFAPPDRTTLDAILRSRRGWRAVIEDLNAALPRARISVWLHEEMAPQPDAVCDLLTGVTATSAGQAPKLNASPGVVALRQRLREEGCMTEIDGVGDSYAPFTPDERAALRDAYGEDLAWLRGGADGLATLVTRRSQDTVPRDRKGSGYGRPKRPQGALGWAG
ncbi:hypothetical protein JANAI62_09910 [Jannaschia pagri]|uniref:Sulfotransferase family protein n=1 Tax=Jannaschia pagri TaxID=2829797 RepID=A0ABQ4NIX4_9RHOB|nr:MULTISPECIES: hypothetical protein [unclassified Jannaschia]GIT90536.1 hypothetical protein JANAI61_09940 [Jannaschia sp. AI_61]GIT94368.1 hypothetical protein JANAI62_09910 [Jannaschia sp. AI_62]